MENSFDQNISIAYDDNEIDYLGLINEETNKIDYCFQHQKTLREKENIIYGGITKEWLEWKDRKGQPHTGYILDVIINQPINNNPKTGGKIKVFLPYEKTKDFHFDSYDIKIRTSVTHVVQSKEQGKIKVFEVMLAYDDEIIIPIQQSTNPKVLEGIVRKILPANMGLNNGEKKGYILEASVAPNKKVLVYMLTTQQLRNQMKVKVMVSFDEKNKREIKDSNDRVYECFEGKPFISFQVMNEILKYDKKASWTNLISKLESRDNFEPAIPDPDELIDYLREEKFLYPTPAQQFIIRKSVGHRSHDNKLSFEDMVIKATPGSGKTLGFLISALKRINLKDDHFPESTPIREEWSKMDYKTKEKYVDDITRKRQQAFQILIIVNTKTLVTQHGNLLRKLIQGGKVNKNLRVELIGDDSIHENKDGTSVRIITHDKDVRLKRPDHEVEQRWQNRQYVENEVIKGYKSKKDLLNRSTEPPNPQYPHIVITTPIKASHFICKQIYSDPKVKEEDLYIVRNGQRMLDQDRVEQTLVGRAFLPTKNLKMMILDEADSIMKNEDFYRAFYNEDKYVIKTKILKLRDEYGTVTSEKEIFVELQHGIKKELAENKIYSIMALSGTFSDENVLMNQMGNNNILSEKNIPKKTPAQACAELKDDNVNLYELPIRYDHVKQFNYIIDSNGADDSSQFFMKCNKSIELCEIFSSDKFSTGNNQILIFVKSADEQRKFFDYIKRRRVTEGSDVFWDFTIDPEFFKPPPLEYKTEEYLDEKNDAQVRIVQVQKPAKRRICIATNKMAQGVDIKTIRLVIQFYPTSGSEYIQKVYRTGRDGQNGASVLFVTERENEVDSDFPYYHSTATLRNTYGQIIEDLPSSLALQGKSCEETFNLSCFKHNTRNPGETLKFVNILEPLISGVFDYIQEEDERKQSYQDFDLFVRTGQWNEALELVEEILNEVSKRQNRIVLNMRSSLDVSHFMEKIKKAYGKDEQLTESSLDENEDEDEGRFTLNEAIESVRDILISVMEKRKQVYQEDRSEEEKERDEEYKAKTKRRRKLEIDYINRFGYEEYLNKQREERFRKDLSKFQKNSSKRYTLSELTFTDINDYSFPPTKKITPLDSATSQEEGIEELKGEFPTGNIESIPIFNEKLSEMKKEIMEELLIDVNLQVEPTLQDIYAQDHKEEHQRDDKKNETEDTSEENKREDTGTENQVEGTLKDNQKDDANRMLDQMEEMMVDLIGRINDIEEIKNISLEKIYIHQDGLQGLSCDTSKENGGIPLSKIIDTYKKQNKKKVKQLKDKKFSNLKEARLRDLIELAKKKEEENKEKVATMLAFADNLQGERLMLAFNDAFTTSQSLSSSSSTNTSISKGFILQCLLQHVLNINSPMEDIFFDNTGEKGMNFDWIEEDKYGLLLSSFFSRDTGCEEIKELLEFINNAASKKNKKIPRKIKELIGFKVLSEDRELNEIINRYKGICVAVIPGESYPTIFPSGILSQEDISHLEQLSEKDQLKVVGYEELFVVAFMKALLLKNVIDESHISTLKSFIAEKEDLHHHLHGLQF